MSDTNDGAPLMKPAVAERTSCRSAASATTTDGPGQPVYVLPGGFRLHRADVERLLTIRRMKPRNAGRMRPARAVDALDDPPTPTPPRSSSPSATKRRSDAQIAQAPWLRQEFSDIVDDVSTGSQSPTSSARSSSRRWRRRDTVFRRAASADRSIASFTTPAPVDVRIGIADVVQPVALSSSISVRPSRRGAPHDVEFIAEVARRGPPEQPGPS